MKPGLDDALNAVLMIATAAAALAVVVPEIHSGWSALADAAAAAAPGASESERDVRRLASSRPLTPEEDHR
jgi:hypothetical protein